MAESKICFDVAGGACISSTWCAYYIIDCIIGGWTSPIAKTCRCDIWSNSENPGREGEGYKILETRERWSLRTITSRVIQCSRLWKWERSVSGDSLGGKIPTTERKGEVAHRVGCIQRGSEYSMSFCARLVTGGTGVGRGSSGEARWDHSTTSSEDNKVGGLSSTEHSTGGAQLEGGDR